MSADPRRFWSSNVSALLYRWTYTRLAHQLDDDVFAWLGGRINGAIAVDCGCGPGVLTAKLLERGAARVVAVDVHPAMLRQTRERVGSTNITRLRLIQDEVNTVFWRRCPQRSSRACDLIVWKRSLYMPRHEAVAALQAARECLAPGGAVVVIHAERSLLRHCLGPGNTLETFTLYNLANRGLSVAGARLGLGPYALYSRAELFELLREAAGHDQVVELPTSQQAFNLGAIVATFPGAGVPSHD